MALHGDGAWLNFAYYCRHHEPIVSTSGDSQSVTG